MEAEKPNCLQGAELISSEADNSATVPPAGTRGEAQTFAAAGWSWTRLPCEDVSASGRDETHQWTSSAASLPAGTSEPDRGEPACKENVWQHKERLKKNNNTFRQNDFTKNRLITKDLFLCVLLFLTWKLQDPSSDRFFRCQQQQLQRGPAGPEPPAAAASAASTGDGSCPPGQRHWGLSASKSTSELIISFTRPTVGNLRPEGLRWPH